MSKIYIFIIMIVFVISFLEKTRLDLKEQESVLNSKQSNLQQKLDVLESKMLIKNKKNNHNNTNNPISEIIINHNGIMYEEIKRQTSKVANSNAIKTDISIKITALEKNDLIDVLTSIYYLMPDNSFITSLKTLDDYYGFYAILEIQAFNV